MKKKEKRKNSLVSIIVFIEVMKMKKMTITCRESKLSRGTFWAWVVVLNSIKHLR